MSAIKNFGTLPDAHAQFLVFSDISDHLQAQTTNPLDIVNY